MSFEIDSFSPIGGQARAGNSPAHWSYESSVDDLATVQAPDYFNEIGTQVSPGDFISLFLTDGKSIITVTSTTLSPPGVVIDPLVIKPGGQGNVNTADVLTSTQLLLGNGGVDISTEPDLIYMDPFFGIGATPPMRCFHVDADIPDTTPLLRFNTLGTNGAMFESFFGIRDPEGLITANPGDNYNRLSGVDSNLFIFRGAATGNTGWKEVATLTDDGGLSLAEDSNLDFGGVVILDDDPGGFTLNNIEGIDPTTRTTIEDAILTLTNLTMIGLTSGSITGPSGAWNNDGMDLGPNDSYDINGTQLLVDSSGTITLSNINALDATTEATILAISGLVTTPDAQLISGNASGFTLNQLKLSLDDGLLFTHAIKTRHNEFNQSSNAIDFFLWDADEDATGDVGTLPVLTLKGDGKAGFGRTSPSAVVDILSLFGDTTPVISMESTSNAGIVDFRTGNRDPNGMVTGAGPDVYYSDRGALSATYENRAVTTDQVWLKRSVNPPEIIELNNSAELDDLASGGVITISTNTTWVIKAPLTTANRIDVTNASIFFHMTGEYNATASITYTGTGTFITSIGLVRIFAQVQLISSSTGTLLDVNGGQGVNLRESSFIGWDNLGEVKNTGFFASQSFFFNIGGGFTLNNNFICTVSTVVLAGSDLNGPFFTVNTNNPFSRYTFADVSPFALGSTGSLLDLNTRINNNAGISATRSAISVGNLFKQSVLTDATINSVADGSPATGTITAMADNGSGGTTISSTTTYFEDEEVTITGTTSYNGTFQIFNVVAGVSFDTITTFVADDATGSVDSVRLTLSLAGGHGISTGDSIKVIDTNFYNGFTTTLNVVSDDITINGVFISTNTGSIERELSLDQTDRRVNGIDNKTVTDSHTIACAHVNDNSTANGAIVNNTFTDIVFGTVGDALIASSTMELWRLVDEINGIFEFFGAEEFDGYITFDFTVESSGGTVDFRFEWQKDTGSGFVDLEDNVQSLVAVGSDAQSVTKTFPLRAQFGDLIRPQITRNSGTSGITTSYATIYVTQ